MKQSLLQKSPVQGFFPTHTRLAQSVEHSSDARGPGFNHH